MKFLLLLLLLAVPVSAADFLDSFDGYHSQIRLKLGLAESNETFYSDSMLSQMVREGLVVAVPLVRGDKNVHVTVTTFFQNSYATDSLVTGVQAVLWSKNDSVKALVYVPQEFWYQQEHKQCFGQSNGYLSRPSYYDYVDGLLMVHPSPASTGDTLKITCWQKIPNIATNATLTNLDQKYRPVVLAYAIWMAAQARQHPLTSAFQAQYEQAVATAMRYDRGINAASGGPAATGK